MQISKILQQNKDTKSKKEVWARLTDKYTFCLGKTVESLVLLKKRYLISFVSQPESVCQKCYRRPNFPNTRGTGRSQKSLTLFKGLYTWSRSPVRGGYFIPTPLTWIEMLKSLHEKIHAIHFWFTYLVELLNHSLICVFITNSCSHCY